MTIGERIKIAREAAGITQVELGEKVGVSGVAIMRYEKDQREPRLEQLRQIALALGISVTELLPEPTEEERATMADIVREIGMPHGPDKKATVSEVKKILQRVAEMYGEKSVVLIRLTSIMSEAGVDKVIEYTKSIFLEYMDESIPRDTQPAAPAPEGKDTTPAPDGSEGPQEDGE